MKYGLRHLIEPKDLLKTDILATFEQIHRSLSHDLKDKSKSGELKATISNLAFIGLRVNLPNILDTWNFEKTEF